MDKIGELRNDIDFKAKTAQDILSGENISDEDMAKADKLMDEVKDLESRVAKLQLIEKRKAEVDKKVASLNEVEERAVAPNRIEAKPEDKETATVKVCDGVKPRHFKGTNSRFNAYASGMNLLALFGNEQAKRFCRNHGIETRAHSIGTASAGGDLTFAPLEQAIIDLREEYGVFRKVADYRVMTQNTLDIPFSLTGATVHWKAEATAAVDGTSTYDQINLVAKKLTGLALMSTEINEDSIVNMADRVVYELGYAFAKEEDRVGWYGTGGGDASGFTGILTAIEAEVTLVGHLRVANVDTPAEITSAHLATLKGRLPSHSQPGAAWFCSPEYADLVFGSILTTHAGSWSNLAEGTVQKYLGKPVIVVEDMVGGDTTQDNKVMIGYGDMKKAAILGERRGFTVTHSEHIKFLEEQIAIKATQRVAVSCNHAIGTSSVAGAFVGLVGANS